MWVRFPLRPLLCRPMFFTYVIKSLHREYYYKGHCVDLKLRLEQHNAGRTQSNKNYRPFELVYFEAFESLKEAIRREKYFKTAAGRRFLNQHISAKD